MCICVYVHGRSGLSGTSLKVTSSLPSAILMQAAFNKVKIGRRTSTCKEDIHVFRLVRYAQVQRLWKRSPPRRAFREFFMSEMQERSHMALRRLQRKVKGIQVPIVWPQRKVERSEYIGPQVITLKKLRARSFCSPENPVNASISSFSTIISFAMTERSFFVSSGAMLSMAPVL
jgi:hypothetical protein